MAIKIKEEKLIDGKIYPIVLYKTKPGKLVTPEEKKRADEFDFLLAKRIREIEGKCKNNGLLNLKGKRGKVLKLWYKVGSEFEFVMDTNLVNPEDREFVWRAIYDHVAELAPGQITERAQRDPKTSHFSYCYRLSKFPWDFVELAGDWTSWSEFFDRKETKNDHRIIEWLGSKALEEAITGRQRWLRPLTKAIHKVFENKDTTIFEKEELFTLLDDIFSNFNKP